MKKNSYISSLIKPALALYLTRLILAALVAFPMFVYLNGKFAESRLGGQIWPIPSYFALSELLWLSRDIMPIFITLLMFVVLINFIATQFLYGGIYEHLYYDRSFIVKDFFAGCGQRFSAFLKIAIVCVIGFVVVALASDLVSIAIGKLFGLIYGPLGKIISVLVFVVLIYIYLSFFVIIRLIQIERGVNSIRELYRTAKELLAGEVRYFIALNMIIAVFSALTVALGAGLILLVYRLPFNPLIIILILILNQAFVFWICLLELIQIKANRRFIKESNYGTQMG